MVFKISICESIYPDLDRIESGWGLAERPLCYYPNLQEKSAEKSPYRSKRNKLLAGHNLC